MTRKEMAENYFDQGYNCAQSVVLAFADLLPIQAEQLALVASSFGGGMGGLHEVCGAVSGMFIVLGLMKGYAIPKPGAAKPAFNQFLQSMAGEFRESQGSIICRELCAMRAKERGLETLPPHDRSCRAMVGKAAELIEEKGIG